METMQLLKYEVIFHWIALLFYLFSVVFFMDHVISRRKRALKIGVWLALIGLIAHSVALGVRWYAVGHGPYLEKSESFSAIVWLVLIMFMVFAYRVPGLRATGIVVLPVCLVVMILGLIYNQWLANLLRQIVQQGRAETQGLLPGGAMIRPPRTFHGIWFISHITSTVAALGAILISVSTAILYLLKSKRAEGELYKGLPSIEVIDDYSFKFAGMGFIFWTIMLVTGALWADQAWGRYWGWDTIEIWSLVTWLLMGIYLHLRKFFRWQGRKAAWLILVCFIFSIATVFVISFVMKTVHSEFFL